MTLFISVDVGAQGIQNQVVPGTAVSPTANQAPATPWAGASSNANLPPAVTTAPAGRPIVIPNAATSTSSNTRTSQESNALMNAFSQFLRGMGGGNVTGRRTEFADVGDSGGYGAGGFQGTGGSTPVGAKELGGPRKIIPPFRKWFDECTKKYGDCKFQNWGIMGDASHRARRSCHNAGEAIDVGPITCSGGQSFKSNSEQFFNIAKCMANDSNNELQVIFYRAEGSNMIRKSDHSGHMHVQLKNCNMIYGQ